MDLKDIGHIPWGHDARTGLFGEFVVGAHFYVLSLSIAAMLADEFAPIFNFSINVMGAFFFLILSVIQFNAWQGHLESRKQYRNLTGFYPFWHDPTIPRIMGFLCLLIGIFLFVDVGVSVLMLARTARHKSARFDDQPDGDKSQIMESKADAANNTMQSVGGISGSLSVPTGVSDKRFHAG